MYIFCRRIGGGGGCYMFQFYIKESSEFYKVTVKKVDVKIGWCAFL